MSLVRQPENPAQAGSLSIDGAGSLSIGGAGSVTLHALAPKGSVTLRLVENSPPTSGTYVYRLSYTSKFLDANEHNHRPTKSISFHASYTIGG
ncbi:MAG: hypothetical protein U5L05_03085 [Rubrivivax sp.]|nr:hypothetical protein [Rubrivivax sp.]